MQIEQAQIKEFMVNAEQVVPDRPTLPSMQVRIGRLKWIAEELCELANAWGVEIEVNNRHGACDNFMGTPFEKPIIHDEETAITEAYDASLDLIVFAVGNGVASGCELQPGWDEVHSSNMSKFIDGYKREDGKWMKGPSYRPANLAPIIRAQIEAAQSRDKQLLLE
jgi:predicted HAD superfamily Cof-like phosphohydrolase